MKEKTCIYFCTLCPLRPRGDRARFGHITSCLYETLQNLSNLYDRKTFYIYNIVFIYQVTICLNGGKMLIVHLISHTSHSNRFLIKLKDTQNITVFTPKIRQATRQADFPFHPRL